MSIKLLFSYRRTSVVRYFHRFPADSAKCIVKWAAAEKPKKAVKVECIINEGDDVSYDSFFGDSLAALFV